jgi:hypothetical protein
MKTQLLIQMLQLSLDNKFNKVLDETLRQVAVDVELNDDVILTDFNNEFYSVRSLNYIKQCFNFTIK